MLSWTQNTGLIVCFVGYGVTCLIIEGCVDWLTRILGWYTSI
jgi:hypothetical protein